MRSQRWSWERGQTVAFAGLLVIALFSAIGALGAAVADWAGMPLASGWLVGSVAGYLLARTLLRRIVPGLLPQAADD